VTLGNGWKRVRRVIEDADLVLEVLDAREPLLTRNTQVEKIALSLGKRLILVLNKADLVPFEVARRWKRHFERQYPTIFISAKHRMGTRKLFYYIKRYAPVIPVRVAVVGYPNVGKSTIINYLRGRHVAPTSPTPGWTKGEQLVRAKTWLIVIDTPGVIPLGEEKDPVLLVIRGVVDPARLEDPLYPAIKLVERVLALNPNAFREAYGIESRDPEAIVEEYARRHGMLLKGGRPNVEEGARGIIRDWIRGKLTYFYTPDLTTESLALSRGNKQNAERGGSV